MARTPPEDDSGIDVVHAPQDFFGDLYHSLLRSSWLVTIAVIGGLVLSVDFVFALFFLWSGGVAGAVDGSFRDAFFFSVQTAGTIGYGAMYPTSTAAHLIVTVESVAALLVAAVATGLVFSKFSIPRARLEFARQVCIFRYDGQPTLALRLSNTRSNYIVEAQVRVTLTRAETTQEGVPFYRLYDLRLLRDRSPALGRSWQVMHPIGADSPLHGYDAAKTLATDLELIVSLTGIDGTSSQTIHGRHRYLPEQLRFGFRYADMLKAKPDGRVELDYAMLHEITPAPL